MLRETVVTVEGLGERVTVRGFSGFGGYTQERLTLLTSDGQVILEGKGIILERMGEGEIVAAGKGISVRFEG